MAEGGASGRAGLSPNGRRRYDRARRSGFTHNQSIRIAKGSLRRR